MKMTKLIENARWVLEAEFPTAKIAAQYVEISNHSKPKEDDIGKIETTFHHFWFDDEKLIEAFNKIIQAFFDSKIMLGSATLKLACPKESNYLIEFKKELKPLNVVDFESAENPCQILEKWTFKDIQPKSILFSETEYVDGKEGFTLRISWCYRSCEHNVFDI